ncbi:MAG TPA: MCE family protein [Mycobacteriales bacterium]|nr:MCE family protein [Mycobacteriales bacterium]
MSRLARLVAATLAGAVALSGCGFHGLYDVSLPGGADLGDHPYHVVVLFTDVLDLVPQAAVRVNDVPVGRVESIDLAGDPKHWHARVGLLVNGSIRLPANARADLRQTSLLGEKYVALSGPTGQPPQGRLRDGAVIPLSRSGRNAQVEEVLSALSLLLNGGGLAQLRTINKELGDALAGHEGPERDLLAQLDTLVGGLDAQRAQITRALDSVNRLAGTLAGQRATIAGALDTLPGALRILADQRAQLTRMLTALQRLGQVGTRVINASRDDLEADLRALEPTLSQLAAAGSNLPNALELLLTYPFPKTSVNGIRGDYTNLFVTADLDVSDVLDDLVTDGQGHLDPPSPPRIDLGPGPPHIPGLPGLPSVPGLPGLPGIPGLTGGTGGTGSAPADGSGAAGRSGAGGLPDLLASLLGGGR